tara:strand:+ start:791 stop:1684 length:894 start_codon:yes stop_codon:yes gene_type:complete
MPFLSSLLHQEEKKSYYFMAGLPRSGSTLLSSLLNQNPEIYSGPSSPVLSTMHIIQNTLSQDELYQSYPKPEQASALVSDVINHYYADVEEKIVIDKNRGWTSSFGMARGFITPDPKVIVPVRDISEILVSFLTLVKRNPYQEGQEKINFIDENLIKQGFPINDRNRCMFLVNNGIVGSSLGSIKETLENGEWVNCHFVEYQQLVDYPQATMDKLYKFLDLESFEHDFDNVENIHREKDQELYGLADMHYVRPKVKSTAPDPADILPPDLLEECQSLDFWRHTPYTEGVQKLPNIIT